MISHTNIRRYLYLVIILDKRNSKLDSFVCHVERNILRNSHTDLSPLFVNDREKSYGDADDTRVSANWPTQMEELPSFFAASTNK